MDLGPVYHAKIHPYVGLDHSGVGDLIPLTSAAGGYIPVNYVPTADTIRGHLEGIDGIIGALAPISAEYVVMIADAGLTDERVLTAGSNISIVDSGAGLAVTISFTGTLDHGTQLTGLGDDDQTQYLLLAGRAGGQTANGGSAAGEDLTLVGTSSGGAQGNINMNSRVILYDPLEVGVATTYNFNQTNTMSTTEPVTIMGGIINSADITVNTGIWFISQIADSSTYHIAVTPGFSAFTLFNAFPVIDNFGFPAILTLTSSLTMQAAVTHRNRENTSVTTSNNTGILYRPMASATNDIVPPRGGGTSTGDMTITAAIGLNVIPMLESDATATAGFGTVSALLMNDPTITDHNGTTSGWTAYYGLNAVNITSGILSGTIVAAVNSAITAGTNNYFLRNTGGAQTTFGAGNVIMAGGDLDLTTATNFLITDNLATSLDITEGANSYLLFQTTNGTERVVVGQDLQLLADIDHDGTLIGFNGAAPVAQDTGWSISNLTTTRSYDADSTSLDELADIVGTLLTYLLLRGDIGA